MRSLLRSVVVLGACVAAIACNQKNRSNLAVPSPTSPADPSPPVVTRQLRIVSGADLTPVRGAVVTINGSRYETGDDGHVAGIGETGAPDGATLDVDASGFLTRRTRVIEGGIVTLWPVADEAEASAVRRMVYQRGNPSGEVLIPPDPGPFYITIPHTGVDVPGVDVAGVWENEAKVFGSLVGLKYETSSSFQYETNEIEVRFSSPSSVCQRVPNWAFCLEPPPYRRYRVAPERAIDPATIRRVLASWFLGPNPLPGLMNAEAPEGALSALELQTIRMILLRPRLNRWPDTDR